jgi:hypothetical protein
MFRDGDWKKSSWTVGTGVVVGVVGAVVDALGAVVAVAAGVVTVVRTVFVPPPHPADSTPQADRSDMAVSVRVSIATLHPLSQILHVVVAALAAAQRLLSR